MLASSQYVYASQLGPPAAWCSKCLIVADEEDADVFSACSPPQTPKPSPRSWGRVACPISMQLQKLRHLKKKKKTKNCLAGILAHQLALLVTVLLFLPLSRQVCVAAVGNTRWKAQEVCRLFGQSLGKPLLIREEETKEWGGHIDSHLSNSPDSLTLQERIQNATAYASCRVFAVFEIKGKENRRNKLL